MLRRAPVVRIDSDEHSSSIIRLTRIGELGTTLAVTSNRITLRSVQQGGILLSRRRENLISYITLTSWAL
jgi:hypothetical protein